MRKTLLATSAFAGIAAFAVPANAQITVTLGGYTEFFAATYDDDRPNRTTREFQLETEIVARADGKADNGLLYGAKIELQNEGVGNTATGIVTDEASVYLAGTWGRLELGDFDGAADTLKIYAPVVGIEQIDGDYTDFTDAGDDIFGFPPAFGPHIPNSGDATKIMYLTPRFAGFQAGASYTPESESEGQQVVAFKNTSSYKDWIEAGINYVGEFGGFGVQLGATLSTAQNDVAPGNNPLRDFTAWNVGGQVSYANFILGGGYVDADDFGVPVNAVLGTSQESWHVGIGYTMGPLALAASYMDSKGYKDAVTYASKFEAYGVGAAYTLAPGLTLQSDLMFIDEKVRTLATPAVTASNDGYVFIVGTRLDF